MPITLQALVDSPDLGTRVVAGATGLDRNVLWAHVCELGDPTAWLSSGELLMTIGYSIPEQPLAQERYIEQLAHAGLSGIIVAEGMMAPALSGKLKAAADRLRFPVLLNAYGVPYTSIIRTVADANRTEEHSRLSKIFQIYEQARITQRDRSGADFLQHLSALVGVPLYIVDQQTGRSIFSGAPQLSDSLIERLKARIKQQSGAIPALLRLETAADTAVAVAVPASRPLILVAEGQQQELPDAFILHHLASVLALEAEKLVAEFERKRQSGSEILAGLIDSRLSPDIAENLLSKRELSDEPRRLAVCTSGSFENENSDLHFRLENQSVPHLILRRTPLLAALLPDTEHSINIFRNEIGARHPIGLSDHIGHLARVPNAFREAKWAMNTAVAADRGIVEYGEESALSPFLPRTLNEAQSLVDKIIGPLLTYDKTHNSNLARSLEVFLSNNRSWQRAAEKLYIHRQTLSYRMRRAEQLTGRNLSETQDVAEFWLALQAMKYLEE